MSFNQLKKDDQISEGSAKFQKAARLASNGDNSAHHLRNTTRIRLAFKVDPSSHNKFRCNTNFGFVEPGATFPFRVTRLVSLLAPPILTICPLHIDVPHEDTIVIQYVDAAANVTDPQAAFHVGPATKEIVLAVATQ
ncbi:Major sperm protein [Aphelenchoides besseyi]|nr:Major sperm protein [Aphelenchoides besseyi]